MKTNRICAFITGAVLLIGAIAGVTTASGQKTSSAPSGAKLALAALDTDHDGTVSKQEFLSYMEAQFDKADTDRDGILDRAEFEQLRKNLAVAIKQ